MRRYPLLLSLFRQCFEGGYQDYGTKELVGAEAEMLADAGVAGAVELVTGDAEVQMVAVQLVADAESRSRIPIACTYDNKPQIQTFHCLPFVRKGNIRH